jgi:taurine dioxygenase
MTTAMLTIRPLSRAAGVEIVDVDLAQVLPGDPALIEEVRALWRTHKLVLFRDQQLTPDQQLTFASWFGVAEASTPQAMQTGEAMPSPVHYISNRVEGGRAGDGELLFHSDSAAREHPLRAVVLHALAVPSTGGDTIYANCVRAYASLPEDLRQRVSARRASHGYDYERYDKSPPGGPGFHAEHPVAFTHPVTTEMVLYLSRNATTGIVGLDSDESDALLELLFSYIEAPEHCYRHEWRVGDVVVWDNIALVHARTAFDPAGARTLQRVTVSGAPLTRP